MSLISQILASVAAGQPVPGMDGWRTPPPYSTIAADQAAAMGAAAPAVAQPPATVPAPVPAKKRGGIMGALGSVFAPEAGSFWHSALANGLWDAKGGQQRYKEGSYDYGNAATGAKINDAKLREVLDAEKNGEVVTSPTGQVLRTKRDGSVDVLWTPPEKLSNQEKLIDRWKSETDPTLKEIIARAIPGFQYSPEFMSQSEASKIRIKGATPGKAPSAAKASKVPAGYVLD